MSEEQIKQYYERIEKLLSGANKETYVFAPEEIRQILRWYEVLQQENQQLKKEVEKWKSYTEITGEEGTCIINELKEELSSKTLQLIGLKDEIKHLEAKLLAVQQQFDMAVSLGNKKQHIIDELEKWLEEEIKHYKEHFEFICKSPSPVPIDDTKIILEKDDLIIQKLESTLNKLQELKGSDKE